MVSNLQPQQIDFESEWTELRKNLDLAFDAKLPRHMYTEVRDNHNQFELVETGYNWLY